MGAGSGGRAELWLRRFLRLHARPLFGRGLDRERNLTCTGRILSRLWNVRPRTLSLGAESELCWGRERERCAILSSIMGALCAHPDVSGRRGKYRNTVGTWSRRGAELWACCYTRRRVRLLFVRRTDWGKSLACVGGILSLLWNIRLLALSLGEQGKLRRGGSGECCVILSIILTGFIAQPNVSDRGREPRNTVGAGSGGRGEPWVRSLTNLRACLLFGGGLVRERNLSCENRILSLLRNVRLLALSLREERELCWRRSGECCVLLSIILTGFIAQPNVSGRGREPRNTVGAWSGGRVEPRVRCFSNLPICLPHSGVMACGRELPYMSRILPLLWDGGILAIRLGEERELCWRRSRECCVLLSIIMRELGAQSNVSDRRCESRNTVGAWSGRGGEAQVRCFIPLRT